MRTLKFISFVFCFFIVTKISFSQNLLQENWQFTTGDDLKWAQSNFDDSNWKTIQAGVLWESQGYDGYDGFGWYRQSIVISKKLKKAARKNGGLILYLSKIDDSDETYWNGKKIGSTGTLPPDYNGEYATPRKYKIPFEAIQFGKKNLIAVRVYDHGGGGGIYGNDIYLGLPGMKDLLTIQLSGIPSNQILLQKEHHTCAIKFTNKSKEKYKGLLEVELKSDFDEIIKTVEKDVTVKGKSSLEETIQLGNLPPGFYSIKALFKSKAGNKKNTFGLGVRPENISSPTNRLKDFDDYWRRAKKELAAVEPQYKLIKDETLSTSEREVYMVEMRSLGNVLVRGFYSKPTAGGKYPAVLNVQGYSTTRTANQLYQGTDMVSMTINIRGHGNSTDNVNPGFPGYILHSIEDKEMYIYRGAYMDCIRAIDFLFSREEVDQSRVAVEGGSQGGALSIATAALDNERIAICLPDVPFLSDWEDYFQTAVWPTNEFIKYLETHPDFSKQDMLNNLSYIDIKNLAPWVKAPVYMAIGLVDEVCPPHINFAAYNEIKSQKEYKVYPLSGHGLPGLHYAAKYAIIKKHFGLLD